MCSEEEEMVIGVKRVFCVVAGNNLCIHKED